MSEKNRDNKNRWRNVTIAFRMSPEENEELDLRVKLRKLIFYHLGSDDQYEEDIRNGLEEKLDALVRHELYTKYKTAPSEEEQEKARQEYLDKRGVSASYRW